MVRVLIPGKAWRDAQKPKPIARRVLVHLLKDVAAQPRTTVWLLIVSVGVVTYLYLGLPYVFRDGSFLRSDPYETLITCDYFGYESFTKEGPDCPWVVWRRP